MVSKISVTLQMQKKIMEADKYFRFDRFPSGLFCSQNIFF